MKATDKAKSETVPTLTSWARESWPSEEDEHLYKLAIDICQVVVGELKINWRF